MPPKVLPLISCNEGGWGSEGPQGGQGVIGNAAVQSAQQPRTRGLCQPRSRPPHQEAVLQRCEQAAYLENAGDELAQATVEHRVAEDRGQEALGGPLGGDEHQHAAEISR